MIVFTEFLFLWNEIYISWISVQQSIIVSSPGCNRNNVKKSLSLYIIREYISDIDTDGKFVQSLIKNKKSDEPKCEPCGTLEYTDIVFYLVEVILTNWIYPYRWLSFQTTSYREIPSTLSWAWMVSGSVDSKTFQQFNNVESAWQQIDWVDIWIWTPEKWVG